MGAWPGLSGREEGELVVVEPLALEHEEGLFTAGREPGGVAFSHGFP